ADLVLFLRICQRSPEPFSGTAAHQQAIGIMYFRSVIGNKSGPVFAEIEHARQRSEAKFPGFLPHEKTRLNLDDRSLARLEHKPIGPRGAGTVEPSNNLQEIGRLTRFFNPILCKLWKFIAAGFGRLPCQAARGRSERLA